MTPAEPPPPAPHPDPREAARHWTALLFALLWMAAGLLLLAVLAGALAALLGALR